MVLETIRKTDAERARAAMPDTNAARFANALAAHGLAAHGLARDDRGVRRHGTRAPALRGGPLVDRVTMMVDAAEFEQNRWYGIGQSERGQVWHTAPTTIRMRMRARNAAVAGYDFAALRHLCSVGESLNAECVGRGREVFGHPFHDTSGQTETGGITIADTPAMDIRPGSMGKPLPGLGVGIVDRNSDGLKVRGTGAIGELGLRAGCPSMMRDAAGYFWFMSRADDLTKSSGHLMGPSALESALTEHPAVAEAAVIGIPDTTAGEVVRASVTLNAGYHAVDALQHDIRGHARKRPGPAVAPREIVFRDNLPKTRAGKIMRRLLKARELGFAGGDISTLEKGCAMNNMPFGVPMAGIGASGDAGAAPPRPPSEEPPKPPVELPPGQPDETPEPSRPEIPTEEPVEIPPFEAPELPPDLPPDQAIGEPHAQNPLLCQQRGCGGGAAGVAA